MATDRGRGRAMGWLLAAFVIVGASIESDDLSGARSTSRWTGGVLGESAGAKQEGFFPLINGLVMPNMQGARIAAPRSAPTRPGQIANRVEAILSKARKPKAKRRVTQSPTPPHKPSSAGAQQVAWYCTEPVVGAAPLPQYAYNDVNCATGSVQPCGLTWCCHKHSYSCERTQQLPDSVCDASTRPKCHDGDSSKQKQSISESLGLYNLGVHNLSQFQQIWINTLGEILDSSVHRIRKVQRRSRALTKQCIESKRQLESYGRSFKSILARLKDSEAKLVASKQALTCATAARHTKLEALLASQELETMNTTENQILHAEQLKVHSANLRQKWSAQVEVKQQAVDRLNMRVAQFNNRLLRSGEALESVRHQHEVNEKKENTTKLLLRMDTNISTLMQGLQVNEQEVCNACPWSEWSTCSLACGGGRRSRHRICTDIVQACEESSQTEICNAHQCESPSIPTNVDFTEGSDWIQLKWDAPPSTLPIELYQVRGGRTDTSGMSLNVPELEQNVTDTSNANGDNAGGTVIFENLWAGTQYSFALRASNGAGWGNWSVQLYSGTTSWSADTSDKSPVLHDQRVALKALTTEYTHLASTQHEMYQIKQLTTATEQLANATMQYWINSRNRESTKLQTSVEALAKKAHALEEHTSQGVVHDHKIESRVKVATALREQAHGLNLAANLAQKFVQAVRVLREAPTWSQVAASSWTPAGFSYLNSPHLMKAFQVAQEIGRKARLKIKSLNKEANVISPVLTTSKSPKTGGFNDMAPFSSRIELLKQGLDSLNHAVDVMALEKDAQLSAFRSLKQTAQRAKTTNISFMLQQQLAKSKQGLNSAQARLKLLRRKHDFEEQLLHIAEADEIAQVAHAKAKKSNDLCDQAQAHQNRKQSVITRYLHRSLASDFAKAHAKRLQSTLKAQQSAACAHAQQELNHVQVLSQCASFLRSNISNHAWIGVLKERVSHTQKAVQRMDKTRPKSAMLQVAKQFLHERKRDLAEAKGNTFENPCTLSFKQASNTLNKKLGQESSDSVQEPNSVKLYKEIYHKEKLRLQQLQTLSTSLTSHTSKMRSLQERGSKRIALANLAKQQAMSADNTKLAMHWDRVASRALHLSHVYQDRTQKVKSLLHSVGKHLEQQQMQSDAASFQKDDITALVHVANEILQVKTQQGDREITLKATQKKLSQLSAHVIDAELEAVHTRQVATQALVSAKQTLQEEAHLQYELSHLPHSSHTTRSEVRHKLADIELRNGHLEEKELEAKQIANAKLTKFSKVLKKQASIQQLSQSQEQSVLGEEQSRPALKVTTYLQSPEQMLLGSPLYAEALLDTGLDQLKQAKEECKLSHDRLQTLHNEQTIQTNAIQEQKDAMSTTLENIKVASFMKEQATKHQMSATSPAMEAQAKGEEKLALSELQRAEHAKHNVRTIVQQGQKTLAHISNELKGETLYQKELQQAVAEFQAEKIRRFDHYQMTVEKLETWRAHRVHEELGATDDAASQSQVTAQELQQHEQTLSREVKHAFSMGKRATSSGYEVDLKIEHISNKLVQIKAKLDSAPSKQEQKKLRAHMTRVSMQLKTLQIKTRRLKKLREHMWEQMQLGSSNLALIRAQEVAAVSSQKSQQLSKEKLIARIQRSSTKLDSILDCLKISKAFHKLRQLEKKVSDVTKNALCNMRTDCQMTQPRVEKANVDPETLQHTRHTAVADLARKQTDLVAAKQQLRTARAKAKERYDKTWTAKQKHRAIVLNNTMAVARQEWNGKIAQASASASQAKDRLKAAETAYEEITSCMDNSDVPAQATAIMNKAASTKADAKAIKATASADNATGKATQAQDKLNKSERKLENAKTPAEMHQAQEEVSRAKAGCFCSLSSLLQGPKC